MLSSFSNSASTRVRRDSGDFYFCELSDDNKDDVTTFIGSDILPSLDRLKSAYVSNITQSVN